MAIQTGDTLPDATLLQIEADGQKEVSLAEKLKGRKVALFALPGAYTGVCTTAHMPSFIRTKAQFDAKGVDEVICVAVNDPFVMKAWGDDTGALAAGITLLCDAESAFTKAVGMDFTAPPVGLIGRSKRYAMYINDGKVEVLHAEASPGECEIAAGESLLASI